MRRLGGYQTITVSIDPDVTDAAAQRKVISTDLYSIDKTSPHLGQANLWCGRYNEGNKVRTNSYAALAKAVLTPPTTSNYTLKIYGYGQTDTGSPLTPASNAAAIQTAIRNVSASLSSVTVTGSSSPYTIANLPSASVTIELVRVTASDTTGSVTQGLSYFDAIRPWSVGLPAGTEVELLAKYPAHDDAGLVGMNALINQALERLWFIDLLHFTSTDADSEQVVYSLASYPWLKTRAQILRVYAPCQWEYAATYTVPGSSHTLSIDVGHGSSYTTDSLAGSATADAIQTALRTLFSENDVQGTVTVTANGTSRTVTVTDTRYADMDLTVSTGAAVTDVRTRTEALRFTDGYRLKYLGEALEIEWDLPRQRGETWYVEVYRPASTWTCPQTDYQTLGTTWASADDGLENDLDQCVPDLHEVVSVVHYLACRQLSLYGPSQESKFWRDESRRAAAVAAYLKSLDLPKNDEPGFREDGLSSMRGWEAKGFFNS